MDYEKKTWELKMFSGRLHKYVSSKFFNWVMAQVYISFSHTISCQVCIAQRFIRSNLHDEFIASDSAILHIWSLRYERHA